MEMNRIGFGVNIKMPIQGVQYSNVENWVSWEEDTQLNFDDAIESQKQNAVKAREFINEVGKDAVTDLVNQLEDLNKRIEKAREEYIKLKNNVK